MIGRIKHKLGHKLLAGRGQGTWVLFDLEMEETK